MTENFIMTVLYRLVTQASVCSQDAEQFDAWSLTPTEAALALTMTRHIIHKCFDPGIYIKKKQSREGGGLRLSNLHMSVQKGKLHDPSVPRPEVIIIG